MIRGCIRSGLPGSCRAGMHIDSAHKAVRPRYAAWYRIGPLPRCPLPGVAGLGRGCSCHAGTSGTGDMGDTPVRSGGDEGFPHGTALVGRRALCHAVHTTHRGVSSRILLPGVRVLSAKLRHSTLGDSGVCGISRRLGSGASLCGAGLLPSWRIRSDGAGPLSPTRQKSVSSQIPDLAWVHSGRRPEALYCHRVPCHRHSCPQIWRPAGLQSARRHRSAYQADRGRPNRPRYGRIQTNAGDDGVNLFRHLDDAEH